MEPPPFSNGSSKRILRSNNVTQQVERNNPPKHSRNASFIKLLGADFSKQLKIPNDFVTVFNGCVPHRFIIESDMTKECWRVEVEKDEDEGVYLREGWVEFVEAHQLNVGDFLLFEYEEQSIFLVKVYNRDGCQKTVVNAQGGKNNPLKIADLKEQDDSEAFECPTETQRTDRSRQKQRKRSFTGGKMQQTTPRKNARVATESLTEHSTSFSVKIDKHMSYQFKQLTVPMAISKAKLVHRKGVTLENAIGDRWPVKLSHIKDGRVTLTRGWKEFLSDNKVAAGDSLRFEFINDDLLKVLVTKASQVEQKSEEPKSPDDCEFDEEDAHTARVILAEASNTAKTCRKRCSPVLSSSSFTFLWGPTTPASYLHVPKIVTEGQNLMAKDKVVLRDLDGKCWPVEIGTRRDGRAALTKGWTEFAKGHAIKNGDSLDFEFKSEYLIQVTIHRGKLPEAPKIIEDDIIDWCTANIDNPRTKPTTVMTQPKTVVTGLESVAALSEPCDSS